MDRAKFHRFWLWEYQRRNAGYRKAYDRYLQKLKKHNLTEDDLLITKEQRAKFTKEDWEALQEISREREAFFREFKTAPKDYRIREDPANLIRKAFVKGDYPESDFTISKEIIEIKDYKWPVLTLEVNLKDDLDLILKELSFNYHNLKFNRYVSDIENCTDIDEIHWLSEKVQQADKELFESREKLKRRGQPPRDLPRAVGLWLWDKLSSFKEGRGQTEKAISAFSFEIEKEDGQFSDEKGDSLFPQNGAYFGYDHLTRIVKQTRKCIKNVQGLPMK